MRWLQSHERLRDHLQEKSVSKDVGRGTPVMERMAHEVYRVVLFGVFYLQVSLLAYVPFIGEQPFFTCCLQVVLSPCLHLLNGAQAVKCCLP